MRGKQPYDERLNTVVVVHLFGGYRNDFYWKKSIAAGTASVNLPFSGKYDFVETQIFWKVNPHGRPQKDNPKYLARRGDKGRLKVATTSL
jgi:hypothetical protein